MDQSNIPSFVTSPDPRSIYMTGSFCALDFETDSEENGSALHEPNDIVLACWHVYRDGKKVKSKHIFGGIYDMGELSEDVSSVDFVLAFNAKFELQWLKRCGLELRDILVYDPVLCQWVLDGNQKGRGFERSLKGMARRYGAKPKLDIVGKLLDAGVPTRDINERWLLDYCWRDVDSMVEIFLQQREVVSQRGVWHLCHTRHLTCAAIADIEFAGLQLNKKKVDEEYARVKARLSELENELAELTGGVNINSPKQFPTYLYDVLKFPEPKDHRGKAIKTEKGARSTKAEYVNKFEPVNEEQAKFLKLFKEYNKVSTLLSKNLKFFKNVCEHNNAVFYGSIKQNSTGTHRLASSGRPLKFEVSRKLIKKTGEYRIKYEKNSVQLQNIPREYKGLFWAADDDYVVCSYDSSQVEFRVAVDMGHDSVGYKEVAGGTDIHSFTAAELTKAGEPTSRQEAKAKTFRPLYGGGSGSPALQAYCEYFKNKYQGISEMQQTWANRCADKKQYTTPYGMTFYFPAKMQNSGYITHTTQIYNFPIQGFATGEIIPIALVYFWHRIREKRADIFVTIHDSIDVRVHKDDVAEVTEMAKLALTSDVYRHLAAVYNYRMRVPLGLGFKSGKHWNEGEELKWDIFPDGTEVSR